MRLFALSLLRALSKPTPPAPISSLQRALDKAEITEIPPSLVFLHKARIAGRSGLLAIPMGPIEITLFTLIAFFLMVLFLVSPVGLVRHAESILIILPALALSIAASYGAACFLGGFFGPRPGEWREVGFNIYEGHPPAGSVLNKAHAIERFCPMVKIYVEIPMVGEPEHRRLFLLARFGDEERRCAIWQDQADGGELDLS